MGKWRNQRSKSLLNVKSQDFTSTFYVLCATSDTVRPKLLFLSGFETHVIILWSSLINNSLYFLFTLRLLLLSELIALLFDIKLKILSGAEINEKSGIQRLSNFDLELRVPILSEELSCYHIIKQDHTFYFASMRTSEIWWWP